jgi:thiamine biosynthesis lipoprotein
MMRLLEHHAFNAMGTSCGVGVTTALSDLGFAHRAIAAAAMEVTACERALTRFDPGSELSRLNAAGGSWTDCGPRLLGALSAALDAREATGGLFDPTILPALVAAGYDRTFEQLEPRPAETPFGWRAGAAVEVDHARSRARLDPGAAVDLGGIGKGYSADRAVAAMAAAWPDMPGCVVDLGGDLSLSGEPPEGGAWRVAVADPRVSGGRLSVLDLAGGGVATSGRDRRRFGRGGELHHLIDPATGEPAVPGPLSVTVVASDAATAEAHATALAITPVIETPRYVAARRRISALVVPAAAAPFMLGDLPAGAPAWAQDVAS